MEHSMEHEQLLPLLRKTAKQDSYAFEELYQITSGQMYAVALKMLQHKESAEEAMQEAFVSIWYKADQYQEGSGTVLTWMLSIVRYRALDMLRHKKVRKEEQLDETTPEPALVLSTQSLAMSPKLQGCMQQLDNNQRQAIHLAYFNGMSHSEVVSYLESPLGTIKSWIKRGLASLQRCLTL